MGRSKSRVRRKARKQGLPKGERARIQYRTVAAAVIVGFIAAVGLIPQYWIFAGSQPYATFVFAALFIGIFCIGSFEVIAASIACSGAIALLYPSVFNFQRFVDAASRANPNVFFGDVIINAYYVDFLFPLAERADTSNYSGAGLFIASILVVGAIALTLHYAIRRIEKARLLPELQAGFVKITPRRAVGLASAVMVLIVMSVLTFSVSEGFRTRNTYEVLPHQYATDYHIYKRTYQLMRQGTIFYKALDIATDEDARGLEHSPFWHGPRWVRHPFLFKIWAFVGKRDPNMIFVLALLLAATGLLLVGFGLEKLLPPGTALFVAFAVFPYFFATTTWENLFSTDLWLSLFGVIAFGAFLSGMYSVASVAASLALLSKFQGIFITGLFLLAYVILGVRKRNWRPLAVFAVLTVGVLIWYQIHWNTVAYRYPEILTEEPSKSGSEFLIGWAGLSGIVGRLNWMCNFVGDLYTHFAYYASLYIPLGILGFLIPLLFKRFRASTAGDALFGSAWVASFSLLIGTLGWACQYWGVQVMPVALVGVVVGVLSILYVARGTEEEEQAF